MTKNQKRSLTHVDASGQVGMVDVSDKETTVRTATASAIVSMKTEVLNELLAGTLEKGDALCTARIAGINAAKQTGSLIPLCHPLPLDWIDIDIVEKPSDDPDQGRLLITATARTSGRTGVEMEAMTAASVAALTIYDMAKAADRAMVIGPIRLEHKAGGRSGEYRRVDETPPLP